MNKAIRILLVLIFLLLAFAACAKTEPAPAVQPTASAQQENSLPTAEQSTPSALEPNTAAPAPAQPPAAAPVDPQTGAINGQTLLDERCVTCHALENVTSTTGTYEEWESIVSRMIQRGANLTDEEKAILVQFLADNYKAE